MRAEMRLQCFIEEGGVFALSMSKAISVEDNR